MNNFLDPFGSGSTNDWVRLGLGLDARPTSKPGSIYGQYDSNIPSFAE